MLYSNSGFTRQIRSLAAAAAAIALVLSLTFAARPVSAGQDTEPISQASHISTTGISRAPIAQPSSGPVTGDVTGASLSQVIFSNSLAASTTLWNPTEIAALVPSGVSSGPAIVETDRGDSNESPFAVGSPFVPDASGEGTSWSTTASGAISTNTTWSQNVLVTGDVTVNTGVTLTILPGVTVFFAANSDDQSSGEWTDKSEILVFGTLIAEGTQAAPIYFTSNASQKAIGDWGAIIIRKNSTQSSIKNCLIHYAQYGIYVLSFHDGPGNLALSVNVQNCTMTRNSYGIFVVSGDLGYPNSGSVAVDGVIVNSLIVDNSEYGIFFNAPTGYGNVSNYMVVENNVIENNSTGIRIQTNTWWLGHADNYPQIRNNTITGNTSYGIQVEACGSGDSSGSDTDVQPIIENNLLQDNHTSIYLLLDPQGSDGTQVLSPTIRYNTIYSATYGVTIADTATDDTLNATLWHNVFYGFDASGSYAINNLTSRQVNARENYWGDTSSEWDAGPKAEDITGSGVDTSSHLPSSAAPILTRIAPAIGQAGDTVTLYGANFGAAPTVSLGNQIWYDVNDNGILDAGEVGVPNVAVELYRDTDGNRAFTLGADQYLSAATTIAGGYYTFTNLQPSHYPTETYLVVIASTNFAGAGALVGYQNSDGAVSGNSDLNNRDHGNVTGILGSGGYVASTAISLTSGLEPVNDGDVDNSSNLTIDFGFYRLSLGDQVWDDVNNNGILDNGESGVPGITVHLVDAIGATVLHTTTTDAEGLYTFTGLMPSIYRVEIVLPITATSSSDIPSSVTPDNNVNGDDNGVIWMSANVVRSGSIVLAPGDSGALGNNIVRADIGSTHNPTVDFGAKRRYVIFLPFMARTPLP